MRLPTHIKLACGHEIVFGSCGDVGSSGQMTHQKTPQVAQAYQELADAVKFFGEALKALGK